MTAPPLLTFPYVKRLTDFSQNPRYELTIPSFWEAATLQYRDESDDKARALRSQLDLCRRMAQEIGDPPLAEKLQDLIKKLEAQAALQNAA